MKYIYRFLLSTLIIFICNPVWAEDFKIVSFKGMVETSVDQELWNIVTEGQLVETGIWIRTGPKASATILLPNRTQTKISRNAEFQLNYQAKQTQVNLKVGKIWSKTNKKPAKITVKAPNAVASIRGTEWIVEVSEDSSSTLAVLEGSISVAGKEGQPKEIDNGQIANISSNGKISVNKLLNPDNYLQFIFRYEVEPFAYAPKSVGEKINKISLLTVTDPAQRTTSCQLDDAVSPKQFLSSVENRDPSCLAKINPNLLPEGKWKVWAKLIKADANFALGDIEAGTRTLGTSPESSGKLYVEAKFEFSNGNYDLAINKLLEGVKEADVKASFYSLLGEIEQAKGNPSLALNYFIKANESDPYWQKPLLKMSQIEIAKSNYDFALTALKLAEKIGGKTNSLASGKAQYFSYRYQLEAAREQATLVLQTDPNEFDMLVALGIVELKAGNHQEALDYFAQALAIEPNYSKAYVFMAVAHLHANEIEQAIIQLERAIKLDDKDPLPHVVASQIFSSQLNTGKAIFHAKEAIGRTTEKTTWGQLANDQQGGANVGRRFLEVGLPNHAKEASQNTKKTDWAGSYLFRAATAPSSLERNSQYIRGFTLDSQAFGSQRNKPDVISRPGDYGYRQVKVGLGEENNDISLKIGTNGKRIEGNKEFSYLTDLGFFGTQRDSYYASDDTDISKFGLGFIGLGWREGFDKNRFFTANIVPFETDGTFPIKDTTARFDIGASVRKDKSIFLSSWAAENGDAEVYIDVSDNCTGIDEMKTSALEFGMSEIAIHLPMGEFSWAAEGAYRQAESDYTVSGPSALSCTDLSSSFSNYQDRSEKIENFEYDWMISANLKQKTGSLVKEFRSRAILYNRDFEQTLTLDAVPKDGIASKVSVLKFRPALGISNNSGALGYSIALIQDYHPLKQSSLSIDDVAGVPTRFEFMNSGGHIDQASMHLKYQYSNRTKLFTNFDFFEIKNNPVYMIFREQWNADLLEKFTLDKFNNPNANRIYTPSSYFAAARFNIASLKAETIINDELTMYSGVEFLDGEAIDHEGYNEDGAYGRVIDLPETLAHIGLTKNFGDYFISGMIYNMSGIVSTAYGEPYNEHGQKINYTRSLGVGEFAADLTNTGGYSDQFKLSLTYRAYF
ncbi:FecR domain-containing protein [Alphaproteobacteria bacterium]|nr:FecR domain-containing protein [Alphaproteobacteria bacterium]